MLHTGHPRVFGAFPGCAGGTLCRGLSFVACPGPGSSYPDPEGMKAMPEGLRKSSWLKASGVDLDAGNETLTKRIRNAELAKHPYIIVTGQKEAQAQKIAVRKRGQGIWGRWVRMSLSA